MAADRQYAVNAPEPARLDRLNYTTIELMNPHLQTTRRPTAYAAVIMLLAAAFIWGRSADGAEAFQIDGYYLGATPEQLNVVVEADPMLEEKYYEIEVNGARLFFIRVKNRLHVYRIVKEKTTKQGSLKTLLAGLKEKYGTPDRQQIKTSSIRPKNKLAYKTTVKNRALWNISDSQEFIVEVESNRVVFELVEHNPEAIKAIDTPDIIKNEEFTVKGWDPDY